MLSFKWIMRAYDLDGNPRTVTDQFDKVVSEEIKRATSRKWDQILDGFDQVAFTLTLDDPMAFEMEELKTLVKLWVSITDDENGVSYESPADTPEFAGIVTNVTLGGQANTCDVVVMSPLWRTSTHFHVLAHRLVIDPDTGLEWTDSELLWKIIDLTQHAFPASGDWTMGISKGTLSGGETLSPWFIQQGSWVWANMQTILDRQPSPDIIPQYYHLDGHFRQMYFNTDTRRGSDKTASVRFDYHTGEKNCDDMTKDVTVQPGQFGNYGWAMGQGGVDTGKVAHSWNDLSAPGSYGSGEIGAYMWQADYSNVNRLLQLWPIADLELKRRTLPIKTYTAKKSPVMPPYPIVHFNVGDLIQLNADKGALQLSAVSQRIYEMHHAMTENNGWQVDIVNADDYKDKYGGGGGGGTGAPTARFSWSQTGTDEVSFTDTSVPGLSGPITGWHWDFSDGGTSTLQNPVHTFPSTGLYSVQLVVDGTGADGSDTTILGVIVI